MKHTEVNKYDLGQEAHIVPLDHIDPEIFAKLVLLCPAGLYWVDEKGQHYNYTHCLECGVCRIIAGEENFKKWDFPANGKGIDYSK